MAELDRLSEPLEWIDSGFVERQRTAEFAVRARVFSSISP
jgi:hypothetical protein